MAFPARRLESGGSAPLSTHRDAPAGRSLRLGRVAETAIGPEYPSRRRRAGRGGMG